MTPDYSGVSVAITGARGYLAGMVLEQLLALSAPPRRIMRVSRAPLDPHDRCVDVVADLLEFKPWQVMVNDADVIFHLAGNTSLAWAETNPIESLRSGVEPVMHIERAAMEANRVPRVVFASTATVHGISTDLPVREDSPAKPVTVYDLHKKFTEEALLFATSRGRIRATNLRLANVYGVSRQASSSADRGILNRIVRASLEGKTIQLYGGGEYLRDYIYVEDVVSAFLLAGRSDAAVGRSFLIGSGVGTLIKDAFARVAAAAEAVTGRHVPMTATPWPAGASAIEFRNFVAAIDAFSGVTGWSPTISLEEGIHRMIAAQGQSQPANR